MPNAKDLKDDIPHKLLVVGPIGVGKTTQFLTLQGTKFAYMFDPSGVSALRGHDVDYEEYLAEVLNVTVRQIPKGGGSRDPVTDQQRLQSYAFAKWEDHFDKAIDEGFFDKYDNILFDSLTTFADIAMDDLLAREGRLQYAPILSDYNIVKVAVARALRKLCALNKTLLVTGHTIYRQSDVSKKMLNEILVNGDLQVRGPLLFSSVVKCDYKMNAQGLKRFTVQTYKDDFNENLKSDIKGIKPIQDVTIEDLSKPESYGLGYLISKDKRVSSLKPTAPLPSEVPADSGVVSENPS